MDGRETSRRAFLLGAGGLGAAGRAETPPSAVEASLPSAGGSVRQSAVGVPGIDTDHGVRWTFDAEESAMVYPTVRTGDAVVALVRFDSARGVEFAVYAFDAATGETRWRRELDGRSTLPEAANGLVYVVDGDQLRALDAADGSDRWRVPAGFLGFREFAVGDREVVFVVNGARVTAVDATQGGELWETEVENDDRLGAPVLGENRVYLGGERGFHALDRETGRQWWFTRTSDGVQSLVAGVRDGMLVGLSEGAVYGLRLADGSRRWRTSHEGVRPYFPMGTVADDTVYVGGETFAAVDLGTGRKRWTFETEESPGSNPEIRGGSVYLPLGSGLVALDADSGRERWRVPVENATQFWGTAVDGLVYAVGRTEATAFDADSGRERWTLDFGDDRGLWADASGGLALVGTRGGTLYAVDRPSALATAPLATAEQYATSPPGLGLLGLLGAGLLGVGYRRAKARTDEGDTDVEFGRLDRLGGGPVTETYRKRVRTPDGPALVAETRLFAGSEADDGGSDVAAEARAPDVDDETRRSVAEALSRWADLAGAADGVLPIREYGGESAADSPPWYETPFLAGGSLADSWPVSYRERVEVVTGVARALHAAHREGVAHGRLAPRHVLRETPDENRRASLTGDSVLVGGWFLADALAEVRDAADPYAPPERPPEMEAGTDAASVEADAADVEDDAYRVGALAYHLLAGAVPDPDPEPASSRNEALAPDLDGVFARALASDPADRYESVLAFDDEFRWAALDR